MNSLMTSLFHNEMQQFGSDVSDAAHPGVQVPGVQRDSGSGPGSSQSLESLESLVLDAEHWVHQLIVDVH